MDYLYPLARYRGVHSTPACESRPTRPKERSVQVERRYGIADTASPIGGIAPEPIPIQNSSINDPISYSTTDNTGRETLVASTACAGNNTIDFRASRHPRAS